MRGRYEKVKKKNPAGKKKPLLIVLAVVVGVLLAIIIAAVIYFNAKYDKMNVVEVPKIQYTSPVQETQSDTEPVNSEETMLTEETAATTEPHVASSADYINFLVVGQQAREDEAQRAADTIMLCTLNTYEKTLSITSFLRDTLVQQYPMNYRGRSMGKVKLTTVYHNGSHYDNGNVAGSMELMNQTLYNNFGVEVDYNFEVNFDMFIKVIDAMQGVTPCLTEAEANYLKEETRWVTVDIEPGYCTLDGSSALAYARMRKAEGDSDSDIKRTERQRKLIAAILKRLRELSLTELNEVIDTALPYVTTSMSKTELLEMIPKLLPMLTDLKIKNSGTCPVTIEPQKETLVQSWGDMVVIYKETERADSVMLFNEAPLKKYMRALTEGEGLDDLHPAVLAVVNGADPKDPFGENE